MYLAVTNGINLVKPFEYTILPEPPCFTHPDGTVRSTDKAAIPHYMVKDQNFQTPNNVETAALDVMSLIKSSLSRLSGTLSTIAKLILQKALSLTKHRADLYFGVYTSPSIKDGKQRTRGNIKSELTFLFDLGIFNFLKLNDFKKELLRFFVTEYHNDEYATILGNKVLYCSVDDECKTFLTIISLMKVENIYEDHLETDTRVAFHAKHVDEANPGNIVIRTNDTDIMVTLLANAKKFNCHIWHDCGLDSVNTRCHVDITSLAKTINYVDTLLGIYVYTGCDYTPPFYQKGKIRPLALMMNYQKYLDAFSYPYMGTAE